MKRKEVQSATNTTFIVHPGGRAGETFQPPDNKPPTSSAGVAWKPAHGIGIRGSRRERWISKEDREAAVRMVKARECPVRTTAKICTLIPTLNQKQLAEITAEEFDRLEGLLRAFGKAA